jgi:hypothetical protein
MEGLGSIDIAPRNDALYMRNSLTKPLRGGSPQIAAAPIRKQNPVYGIFFINPPR